MYTLKAAVFPPQFQIYKKFGAILAVSSRWQAGT
jgi:hypothetical protein